jgi:NAD(P) transhydrogenase subunit alpha
MEAIDPIVFRLTIFVLAIFVGYFVVWSVTPALHTPLMAVTNAISSVIVVGALIAVSVSVAPRLEKPAMQVTTNGDLYVNGLNTGKAPPPDSKFIVFASAKVLSTPEEIRSAWTSKGLGFVALILACVNIFGGFLVTSRMLAMYKKKEK